jgi:hypothetical protein
MSMLLGAIRRVIGQINSLNVLTEKGGREQEEEWKRLEGGRI